MRPWLFVPLTGVVVGLVARWVQSIDLEPTSPRRRGMAGVLVASPVEIPQSKAAVQRILRGLGHKGLLIESIEEDRVFALTGKQLTPVKCGPPEMKRKAKTFIFKSHGEDGVEVLDRDGWIWADG